MMTISDTYEGLKDLEDLLNEHRQAKSLDPARAHQIEHLIRESMEKNHLEKELEAVDHGDFEALSTRCHEIISGVKNSQTKIGMHVFGQRPVGGDLYEYINTILRFDSAAELNTRRLVFDFWGEDLADALKNPGGAGKNGRPYSELLFDADRKAVSMIERIIDGWDEDRMIRSEFGDGEFSERLVSRFQGFADLVIHVARRIGDCRETESLLNAMNGGHVPAGPSGFISRGRYDILPTGRNMYNVDPTRIPTQAAWRVGVRLAEALLARYLREEGGYPESDRKSVV
jgi:cobaltochelatase CobN